MTSSHITRERVAELFNYHAETGEFRWKAAKWRTRVKAGDVAGFSSGKTGYRMLRIDGKSYFAHRVAWLYAYGSWPALMIDHIDGNRANNAISNLRDVSRKTNAENQKKAQVNNVTKLLGVTRRKRAKANPYQAWIRINGKPTYLGVFKTPEDASAAYLQAKRCHHEGCTI